MAQTSQRPPQFAIEQRRAPRIEVSFRARLRHADQSVRVHVVDVSTHGLCARWERSESAGIVQIALPGIGDVAARIVWALGGRIGAEFIRPIEPAAFAKLLAAAPHQSPWHD